LPPLRERREDIPLLVEHFIKKYSLENKIPPPRISEAALKLCLEYYWPGNVRELENAIENAIVLGDGATILPEHLPFGMFRQPRSSMKLDFLKNSGRTFKDKVEAAEKLILHEAIEQVGGNKSEAAKLLDISLRTMRYKIKKYRL
jgi:DNA-binding NtrC family response regulator